MPSNLEGKFISRSDLESPQSSAASSPDLELDDLLRSSIQHEYLTPKPSSSESKQIEEGIDDEAVAEEVEFRLFSSTQSNQNAVSRIRIDSPGAENRPAGFLRSERPRSYYFADSPSVDEQQAFAEVAVTGEDIITRSKTAWPGCSLPWRVVKISQSGKLIASHNDGLMQADDSNRRKRAGKKARIRKRSKIGDAKTRLENQQIKITEKEAAEKEKKRQKNRANKIKRREKDRAKKAVATADEATLS